MFIVHKILKIKHLPSEGVEVAKADVKQKIYENRYPTGCLGTEVVRLLFPFTLRLFVLGLAALF